MRVRKRRVQVRMELESSTKYSNLGDFSIVIYVDVRRWRFDIHHLIVIVDEGGKWGFASTSCTFRHESVLLIRMFSLSI
jgi:hypothetical protein